MDLGPNNTNVTGAPGKRNREAVVSLDIQVNDLRARIDSLVLAHQTESVAIEKIGKLEKLMDLISTSANIDRKQCLDNQYVINNDLKNFVSLGVFSAVQDEYKAIFKGVNSQIKNLDKSIHDLTQEMTAGLSEVDAKVDAVVDESARVRGIIKAHEAAIGQSKGEIESLKKALEARGDHFRDLTNMVNALSDELHEVRDTFGNFVENNAAHARRMVDLIDENKRLTQAALVNIDAALQKKLQHAVDELNNFPYAKELTAIKEKTNAIASDYETHGVKSSYLEKVTDILQRKVERMEVQIKSLHLKE